MDSTLALGAFRIARGAGGEAVDVNGNLVERGKHHLNLHLNLGVGCAPSCWRIFGFRTSWVLAGGAEGSFLCSLITDFLAEGAGWGASPGPGGELGCQAQQVLKKCVRLASAFPSPPTRSLANRKGRGRRSCT